METKSKGVKVLVSAVALVGLSGVLTLAIAGSLEPSSPPAPTMKTLDEIYNAVVAGSSGISEIEGYYQHYELAAHSNETFFTVPAGKRFVLLKLWFNIYDEKVFLTVNDNLFISSVHYGFSTIHSEDFPDRCVVVNAGETLKVVNESAYTYRVTIVGYFCDVE